LSCPTFFRTIFQKTNVNIVCRIVLGSSTSILQVLNLSGNDQTILNWTQIWIDERIPFFSYNFDRV
jgi:hypothetical protein